jgi:hypothetical protein
MVLSKLNLVKENGKNIPVIGREGPQGCETLRLLYFLGDWFTSNSKAVSFTCWETFALQEDS